MASTLFDLTGKVAVVSGAASGMGKAMSLALAEFGADLLLVDIKNRLFARARRKHAFVQTGNRVDGYQRHRRSLYSSGLRRRVQY